MDKHLPFTQVDMAQPENAERTRKPRTVARLALLAIFVFVAIQQVGLSSSVFSDTRHASNVPLHAKETLQKCRMLHVLPGPPGDFNLRTESDRFVSGTKATLIRNATIWTGRVTGLEIVHGDILLDGGMIKDIGKDLGHVITQYNAANLMEINAHGAWVTPGIVDLHSHLGVDSAPALRGASDTNSVKGIAQPWLRSLDGLNTHDEAYRLSISGGVTTALVLPGSANAIGGQAFTIKLRSTAQRTSTSMLLEPPFTLNGSHVDPELPPRWRQMKHACGENPSRVYGGTRMDTIWAFRQAYEHARQIKVKQDDYCAQALSGDWRGLGDFPEDLQWEALVDVLRGRVKIQNHCYETVDLDDIVRLTQEFKFSIAAFHHAHETYLVSERLKEAYGHPPAIAMFATNARYKREAYRGSEFAPKILAEAGLSVVMKSDHPVLNSRYLLYEAQQAHYYGLPWNLAMASVISTPATIMGMDHRIGHIKKGYDADIVMWDSHPLALGATPMQVWIDGILQLENPTSSPKPRAFQRRPKMPNFDKQAADALKYDGLPPIEPKRSTSALVVFTNVKSIYERSEGNVALSYDASNAFGDGRAMVVVKDGNIICRSMSKHQDCTEHLGLTQQEAQFVNLDGGSLSPGLLSYGSALGLVDIQGEISTQDGYTFDPLVAVPSIIGGQGFVDRASDGLQFSSRDAFIAYRAGVTAAVVSPQSGLFLSGLGTAFATGAKHRLEDGAVIQETTALHVNVRHFGVAPSVSTQIAVLRRLLLGEGEGELGRWFKDAGKGEVRLVINVESADAMASLIRLKDEVENATGGTSKWTFSGATEAHLLAPELAAHNIGIILKPARPFPASWESRRVLPGPPLSIDSSVSLLMAHNVTVGLGITEEWEARNTRLDVAWAALESPEDVSKAEALALASTNLEYLLGLDLEEAGDMVATIGGDLLDHEASVVAVISPRRNVVEFV